MQFLIEKTKKRTEAKWQTQKIIWNKKLLNTASKNLKEMLKEHNNNKFNTYISNLSPSEN